MSHANTTMKLRVLRQVSVYRPGTILPIVPRGQALDWIRQRIAEEVVDESEPVETATVEHRASDAVETATVKPYSKRGRRSI